MGLRQYGGALDSFAGSPENAIQNMDSIFSTLTDCWFLKAMLLRYLAAYTFLFSAENNSAQKSVATYFRHLGMAEEWFLSFL